MKESTQRKSSRKKEVREDKVDHLLRMNEELEYLNTRLIMTQQELEVSRQKYFELFENAPMGYLRVDNKGVINDINNTGCALLGYQKSLLKNIPFASCLDKGSLKTFLNLLFEKNNVLDEKRLKLANGRYVNAFINRGYNFNSIILTDVTQLRKAEKEQTFLSSIVKYSDDAICSQSFEGTITSWNKGAESMFGYTANQIIGENIDKLLPENGKEEYENLIRLVESKGGVRSYRTQFLKRDGELINVSVTYSLLKNKEPDKSNIISIIRDISEQVKYEEDLNASLKEKKVLLKEVHHRVKNNLQIIYSLLSLQKSEMDKPDMVDILTKIQNRIRAMALVHEQLYKSEKVAAINLKDYIAELSQYIGASYQLSEKKVRYYPNVDDIYIKIDFAIAIGLIVNELLTNSLKYAFDSEGGTIKLSIKSTGDHVDFYFADDGKGMTLEQTDSSSLGLTIVRSLVEQNNGNLEIKVSNGTEFHAILSV